MWNAVRNWFTEEEHEELDQHQLKQNAIEQSIKVTREMAEVQEALQKSTRGTRLIRQRLLELHEQVEALLLESCDVIHKPATVGEHSCTENHVKMQRTRGALLEELTEVREPLEERLVSLVAKEYELQVRFSGLEVQRLLIEKELGEKISPQEMEERLERLVLPPSPVEVTINYETRDEGDTW
ncbi:hypothetical protein ADEAN_000726000 [Angomonas deanei]|uniref:Uncharacterized protein n=1 Tax=Angomonas deanei TaxID=59799 RepID=A0A7G2CLG0_9TRYP|nr:hypothetical protein ADEAN_000726000 [Angomonas deanei]